MTDENTGDREVRKLQIKSLQEPGELYPRMDVDSDLIERYRDILFDLPPITVSQSENEDLDRIIIDGVHRKRAFEAEDRKTIPCTLLSVEDEAEILTAAAGSNTAHGAPLTAEERRETAKELWQQDVEKNRIAATVGRARRTVDRWLEPLEKKQRAREREEAVRLREEEDMTFPQIAESLGVSRRTARRRYHHGAESTDDDSDRPETDGDPATPPPDDHEHEPSDPDHNDISGDNGGHTADEEEVQTLVDTFYQARTALEGLSEESSVDVSDHEHLADELVELHSVLTDVLREHGLLRRRQA